MARVGDRGTLASSTRSIDTECQAILRYGPMNKAGAAFTPDKARLKELIVYIAKKCRHDRYFGAVKLNKILWRSDFMAYAQEGEPITGSQYIKKPQGPVASQLLEAQGELEDEERVVVTELSGLGGFIQRATLPRSEPDLSVFTASQIAIVDEVISNLHDMTATEASQMSHGKAWRVAYDGEVIPYEAVFLAEEITKDDIALAHDLCVRAGLI